MSYEINPKLFGSDVSLDLSGPWTAYWLLFIRAVTGWWMMHAGLTKLIEVYVHGQPFDASWFVKFAASGTIVEPIVAPFASGAGLAFMNFMIPIGEFLIGLGVLIGCMTRLAAFFGAFLMFFFYFVNADWGHGLVSSDLMGLILFITVAVFGAGRVFGVDMYLERTRWAQNSRIANYILG